MIGYLICAISFLSTSIPAMVNWRFGLCALITWGYFFGILKAHFFASAGHFIYDSATVGFYLGLILRPPPREELSRRGVVLPWLMALVAWPVFVSLIPIQHYLVQLVGLRGNIFWLPMLLIGTMVDNRCRTMLAFTLAFLNIFVFGVAIAEFFLGVDLFVPDNEVTKIVHMSNDLAGGSKRIPATFANAHSYAGAMLQSIPWIVGELIDRGRYKLGGIILVTGLICALLGIFIAGPRLPVVILGALVLSAVFSRQINLGLVIIIVLAGAVVGLIVAQDERFQRFTNLADTDQLAERINISYNVTYWEVFAGYPMGNGMGAGGTSLPYFVENLLENRVILENEYARIYLEQGFLGFALWLGFIFWFLSRRISKQDPAKFSKGLIWLYSAITFGTAWVGIGLMSTIPGTTMLFLGIGYCASPSLQRKKSKRGHNGMHSLDDQVHSGPLAAYQRGLAKAI